MKRASNDARLRERVVIALLGALNRVDDQRVCQILVNAIGKSDPFYVEDEALVEALNQYAQKKAESGDESN